MVTQPLIVSFDIETIEDIVSAKRLLNLDSEDKDEIIAALKDYHLNATKGNSDFIRQLFHQIVAISVTIAALRTDEDNKNYYEILSIESMGLEDSSEKEIIQEFIDIIEKHRPTIVSFNGRGFDLPVVKYRAAKHGIPAKKLLEKSYSYRYDTQWHCDLQDVLSDFGASARIKLSEICALFSIPCKIDVDGSKVSDMFYNNELQGIREYCEIDTINTYIVYLRYKILTGHLSPQGYQASIISLNKYITEQGNDSAKKFLAEWQGMKK